MNRPEPLHGRSNIAKIGSEVAVAPDDQAEAFGVRISDPEIVWHDVFPTQRDHEGIDENRKPVWIRVRGRKMKHADLGPAESVQIEIGDRGDTVHFIVKIHVKKSFRCKIRG